jgi:hypothetical protein
MRGGAAALERRRGRLAARELEVRLRERAREARGAVLAPARPRVVGVQNALAAARHEVVAEHAARHAAVAAHAGRARPLEAAEPHDGQLLLQQPVHGGAGHARAHRQAVDAARERLQLLQLGARAFLEGRRP